MSTKPTVSIVIANYKSDPFYQEAVDSCRKQTVDCEIITYFDDVGIGTGQAFNEGIKKATGDIVVLLCSDDIFTDNHVIEDIIQAFEDPRVSHVSRWYYQYVNGDPAPVRAWRGTDVVELANNPSGMAFRKSALPENPLTNRIFVEVAEAVVEVLKVGTYKILQYDTIAVRIHKSISRTPGYYKKMFTTSPAIEWTKLGWKCNDFTSLIQIKNNFTTKAVVDEIGNFVKLDKRNLFNPAFWFFSIVAVVTPRPILYRIPEIYRSTIGKWTTRVILRSQSASQPTTIKT